MKNQYKRTATAMGIALALGIGTSTANAAVVEMSWSGLLTLLDPAGAPSQNTSYPYYGDPTWGYGTRTQISGTLSFDLDTGTGTATVAPFNFFSMDHPPQPIELSIEAIGDGMGGQGTLLLANGIFFWGVENTLALVWDAVGMFSAMSTGYTVTDTISGIGALPASDGIKNNAYPIGPAPIATTTWNTTPTCDKYTVVDVNGVPTVVTNDCTVNPSGELPLIADSIGGSPVLDGNFEGFNFNIDITTLHIDQVVVPVPAAIWLFGSGLLGLCGVSWRRRD